MSKLLSLILCAFALVVSTRAQDEAPPPKAGHVRITFLPPPMEGTISLGIYNKAGKLVRALHVESVPDKDFVVGLNGLTTHWDGKDDAGNPVAPGKYFARGYCVGALDVEGIAFRCNDWITDDDSPRIKQIQSIAFDANNSLLVQAVTVDDSSIALRVARDGKASPPPAQPKPDSAPPSPLPAGPSIVKDGRILPAPSDQSDPDLVLTSPVDSAPGPDGSLWVIDKEATAVAVKQFSKTGEFLRRLSVPAGDPAPQKIAASQTTELIALLEVTERIQRVRALELETPAAASSGEAPGHSNWRTLLAKSILASNDFASVADKLGRDKPFLAEEKVRVHLLPNPLFKDAVHDLDLRIALDAKGSNLVTPDGLALCRVTETPGLKWAVIGREGGSRAILFLQGDGAVVEEFRANKLANMMAFDAGDYDWK